MTRLGRQIPHFEQTSIAEVSADFSACGKFRYLLRIPFSNSLYDTERSRVMTVILKNPSSADTKLADATIRKVETFVYRRFSDVSILQILNLFALRATDATELNSCFLKEGYEGVTGPENDNYIANFARSSDYLIAAWGNRSGINRDLYEERIVKVTNLISGFPAHRVLEIRGRTKTIQPLHGLMWGYDFDIVPFFDLKRIQRDDLD